MRKIEPHLTIRERIEIHRLKSINHRLSAENVGLREMFEDMRDAYQRIWLAYSQTAEYKKMMGQSVYDVLERLGSTKKAKKARKK